MEVWEEGSDGWIGVPVCSVCKTSLRVVVNGREQELADCTCLHGTTVGQHCDQCQGRVGGRGPDTIEPGQIWAARGGEHGHHNVLSAGDTLCLMSEDERPRPVYFDSEENMRDEFFYIGELPGWRKITNAAHAHDQESPEMGFGDLETALSISWDIMTEAQRARFMRDIRILELLAWNAVR